jgi:hypothetical protein
VIPTKQEDIDKMKELAERNIANGDWGDETTTLGLPGETVVPQTPKERDAKRKVADVLAKRGSKRLPKK